MRIAIIGTFLCFAALLGIPVFLRPAPFLYEIAAFYLFLIVVIGWLAATVYLASTRKWRAAFLAAIFFIGPLAISMWPAQWITQPLNEAAVRLEFMVQQASYDAQVEKTPKGDALRLIRVSHRDVSGLCCGTPLFEEIWFDESDAFASPDAQVRDHRLQSSHPWRPDQTRRYFSRIRPLGGHYYFIDIRN